MSGNNFIETVKPERYDLVVVGGGMAGVCAAIAAARNGCRTALVQDRPVLGGNSSSEIRMHICGADHLYDGTPRRETGIIEELRLADMARNPQRSPSMWDLLLYEWVKREALIDLYLNTVATETVMAGPACIGAVRAWQLGTEREFLLEADLFADCSGDGQVAAQAGADFQEGREPSSLYGEDLAVEAGDRHRLGSSLMFMARDMGRPMPFIRPEWAFVFPDDASLQHRPHHRYGYGYWWIEWGGLVDTIKDNELIRDELLKYALGVWDHIKNRGDHGADNWALDWVGMVPGKRESRRFLGDYVLRQSDLEEGRVFDDEVAYGGWPIDTHPIEGIHSAEKPCRHVGVPLYSIPLRCLYSRNVDNLFFAGRNASASHIAFASTRVMATCALMGQAVGTAAAVCRRCGILPRQAAQERLDDVQQSLLADDAWLLGHRLRQAPDFDVLASSSRSGCGTDNLTDGFLRPDEDEGHFWESGEDIAREPWLELRWPEERPVTLLQLTFDSHLEERLLLTQESFIYDMEHVMTGMPQRLLRSLEVRVPDGDGWRTVRRVEENTARMLRLTFEPALRTDRLRLVFQRTWGYDRARLFALRTE